MNFKLTFNNLNFYPILLFKLLIYLLITLFMKLEMLELYFVLKTGLALKELWKEDTPHFAWFLWKERSPKEVFVVFQKH